MKSHEELLSTFEKVSDGYLFEAVDCFRVSGKVDIDHNLNTVITSMWLTARRTFRGRRSSLDSWYSYYSEDNFSRARSYFWYAAHMNSPITELGMPLDKFNAIRENQSMVVDEWGLVVDDE